jgi:sugar PTS system EIIA component
VIVRSPLAGTVRPLSEVPDPVFAEALVGPGLAVEPAPGPSVVVSPVDGEVSMVHPHAFVVVGVGGRGVLVHLGIDTVTLGAGFETLAVLGDTVVCGQPMVRWDPAAVTAAGLSTLCPVIALDAAAGQLAGLASGSVSGGDPLFTWAG